jgi:hypothetical protein
MADFTVRSDSVDVEQIMAQIRARIREKRGVDYTEDQIRELASVKLERFLDPSKVRSGLIEEFRKLRETEAPLDTYEFGEDTLYQSHRLPLLRQLRRLLNPILKLFFNPNPLIQALHIQSRVNERLLSKERLDYEITSNLVLELTRLSIEVKNLKMRVESLSARLDFDEHRARALEGAVQYRADALAGAEAPAADAEGEEEPAEGEPMRARRRRRRRGRRRGTPGSPTEASGQPAPADAEAGPAPGGAPEAPSAAPRQDAPPRDHEPPAPDQ